MEKDVNGYILLTVILHFLFEFSSQLGKAEVLKKETRTRNEINVLDLLVNLDPLQNIESSSLCPTHPQSFIEVSSAVYIFSTKPKRWGLSSPRCPILSFVRFYWTAHRGRCI